MLVNENSTVCSEIPVQTSKYTNPTPNPTHIPDDSSSQSTEMMECSDVILDRFFDSMPYSEDAEDTLIHDEQIETFFNDDFDSLFSINV